jgi:hypothetical protein
MHPPLTGLYLFIYPIPIVIIGVIRYDTAISDTNWGKDIFKIPNMSNDKSSAAITTAKVRLR